MSERPWWGRAIPLLRPLPPHESAPLAVDTVRGPVLRCNVHTARVRVVPGVLGSEQCRGAIELLREMAAQAGAVQNGDATRRRCTCAWIEAEARSAWLYDAVARAFTEANEDFQFDLTGMVEPLMGASYGAGDHFDTHVDNGPEVASLRKLSLSLVLTPPHRYEGGELVFAAAPHEAWKPEAGSAVVFPSYLAHRVQPVVSGRRISLVAFAAGPSFR